MCCAGRTLSVKAVPEFFYLHSSPVSPVNNRLRTSLEWMADVDSISSCSCSSSLVSLTFVLLVVGSLLVCVSDVLLWKGGLLCWPTLRCFLE